MKCMVHKSIYQYGGIRSNINQVYILARVQIPEILKRELSTFIAGIERKLIAEKHILGIKFTKGGGLALRKMRSLQRHHLKE